MERCVHCHLHHHRGYHRCPRRRSCERAERFAHRRRHYNCAVERRAHCARHRRRPNFRRDCRHPRSCEVPPTVRCPSHRGSRRLQNCAALSAR